MPKLGYFGQTKVSTFSSFNKFLPVLYFEGADLKSDIVFQKFQADQKVSTF